MAAVAQVTLAREEWSGELAPVLRRAFTGLLADLAYDRTVQAIERGDMHAFVARRDGRLIGLCVLAVQRLPLPELVVVAMGGVPRSGFALGPAFMPAIRDLARRVLAVHVKATAETEANRRRLGRIGFEPISTVMVAPL